MTKSAAKSSGGGDPGWSDTPLELGALKAADVDFNLSANALLYRKLQIGKSALALRLKDGRFEADLVNSRSIKATAKARWWSMAAAACPRLQPRLR